MISPTLHDALAKPARNAFIIWAAMMAALPAYVALAWIIGSKRLDAPAPPSWALPGLALLAIANLIGGRLMYRFAFTDAALRKAPAAPATIPIPSDLPPRDRQLFAVLAYAQARMIIVWASFETVGIYGLLAVFTGHSPQRMLPFAAVALAALALHRPRLMEVVERADALLPHA
ncbi:MAG: hypothetical protein ACYDIE_01815 [Candidatus Krumholzibacteriia bacterium]